MAGAGLVAGVVALIPLAGQARVTFCATGRSGGCSYVVEPVTSGLQLVILLAAGVCLLLSIGQRVGPPRAEHHLLLLSATAGAVAVAGSRDLATLLVALETASLPVVGLVGLRRDGRGAEAAVKLLLTSVVSVALLVLGIAMLYAASGTLHLGGLGDGPAGADGRRHPSAGRARADVRRGRHRVQAVGRAVPALDAGHLRRCAAADRRLPGRGVQGGRAGGARRSC